MPQDGTQVTDDGSGLAGGLGGNYGMLPLMGMAGVNMGNLGSNMGNLMDAGFMAAMNRQRWAQALMNESGQVTPLRSPWQAAARAVSGLLGGYEMTQSERLMGQAQARMQQEAAQGWAGAQKIINDAMQGGGGGPGGGPGAAGPGGGQGAQPEAGAYEGAILRHEGYARTPPPGSTAQGWGGFLNGTWQNFAAANPDLFKGMTPEQILAARNDPNLVSKAITWVAQQNAPVLQRNNVPVTGQSLGLAHFLGGQGASWMWNAGDNTPARQVLEANLGKDKAATWIAANPQLGTKTVGQLKQDYASFPNPVFVGATATGPGGAGGPAGGGGPTPGSGYAAMLRLSMLGAQMAQNVTNPYMAAMGRNLIAMAPRLAQIGQFTQPEAGPAPGTYIYRNPVTNQQFTAGPQLTPESFFANDFALMQKLNAQAGGDWSKLSPQEQQAYNEAWARQSHLITDPATRRQTMTSPDMLVPGLLQPPGYSGGGAGGGPGGPAGGTRPIGQAGTAIEQTAQQAEQALTAAGKAQAAAYDNARDAMASNQAIRSLSTATRPGALAGVTVPAANIMEAFGIAPDRIRAITGQDPTAAQVTAKQLFSLLGEKIQQQGNIRAQALWERFQKALPSMESTRGAMDAVTRMYDAAVMMERQYADDRVNYVAGMGRKFRLSQNPADWDEKGMAEFDKNWASQPQNDPRVWNGAAMLATNAIRQARGETVANPESWRIGLSKQQQDLAEQRAAQMWPNEIQYHPPNGGGG